MKRVLGAKRCEWGGRGAVRGCLRQRTPWTYHGGVCFFAYARRSMRTVGAVRGKGLPARQRRRRPGRLVRAAKRGGEGRGGCADQREGGGGGEVGLRGGCRPPTPRRARLFVHT